MVRTCRKYAIDDMSRIVIFDEFFVKASGGSIGCRSRVLRPKGRRGARRKPVKTSTSKKAGWSVITFVGGDGERLFMIVTTHN